MDTNYPLVTLKSAYQLVTGKCIAAVSRVRADRNGIAAAARARRDRQGGSQAEERGVLADSPDGASVGVAFPQVAAGENASLFHFDFPRLAGAPPRDRDRLALFAGK